MDPSHIPILEWFATSILRVAQEDFRVQRLKRRLISSNALKDAHFIKKHYETAKGAHFLGLPEHSATIECSGAEHAACRA